MAGALRRCLSLLALRRGRRLVLHPAMTHQHLANLFPARPFRLPSIPTGPHMGITKNRNMEGLSGSVDDSRIPIHATARNREQSGELLRIDPVARIRAGLSLISNKTCRALVNGTDFIDGVHLEVIGSKFSIRQGDTVLQSASLDDLGPPELLRFSEDYGTIPNVTIGIGGRGLSMSITRPNTISGLRNVIIHVRDVTQPSTFHFQADSMTL